MHLALTLISSILLITHVQSIPNGCQRGIDSLRSVLAKIASDLGNNGPLRNRVSNLAKKLNDFSNQERTARRTGASMGSPEKCMEEINKLHKELVEIAGTLNSSEDSNRNAVANLNYAIELVREMTAKRCALQV